MQVIKGLLSCDFRLMSVRVQFHGYKTIVPLGIQGAEEPAKIYVSFTGNQVIVLGARNIFQMNVENGSGQGSNYRFRTFAQHVTVPKIQISTQKRGPHSIEKVGKLFIAFHEQSRFVFNAHSDRPGFRVRNNFLERLTETCH